MPEVKNKRAFTGLTEFYYGVLDETETKIAGDEATRIEFLQNITVSTGQDIVKAYGDNTVAEMAMATDVTALTTQFHTIPIQDRSILYGFIESDGLYGLPASPNPPYVACMFTKTREDGSAEHIGFTKGKFKIADVEGQTKGESVEFGNDSTEGEFMAREVEGVEEHVTFLIASDAPGETENRNTLYEKIFGVPHPDGAEPTTTTTTTLP